MKKEAYEALELEVIRFDTEDIITTSGEDTVPTITDFEAPAAPEATAPDETELEAEIDFD